MMVVENVRTYSTSKRFYIFHNSRLPFQTANQHCMVHHNGTLAVPNDNESITFLSRELETQFSAFGSPFHRIGLLQQNNKTKWVNERKFTGNTRDLVRHSDAAESCIGFTVRHETNIPELRFHSWNCSYPLRYVCEKQNQKAIEKPTTQKLNSTKLTPTTTLLPSASRNPAKEEVENTPTIFRSTTTGSNNTTFTVKIFGSS